MLTHLCVTHDWFQFLEHGLEVGAVFGGFFLQKAFDTVPHVLLLSKLVNIGLESFLVTWVHNILSG